MLSIKYFIMKKIKFSLLIFIFSLASFISLEANNDSGGASAADFDCGCTEGTPAGGITWWYQTNSDCCSQSGLAFVEVLNEWGEVIDEMWTSTNVSYHCNDSYNC